MTLARTFVLLSYGLFSIGAQSLLFREFITTFEGNDIAVGIFFGSWFLWVGGGAALVGRSRSLAGWLAGNIEVLLLCYLPAFIVQFILIVQGREIAGLESYALWSFRDILFVSFVVNAPVSILTGVLFPTACRWVGSERAVWQVYVIEAAGSFVGGVAVTLLLWLGADAAAIFLILATVVCGSVFTVRLAQLSAAAGVGRKLVDGGGDSGRPMRLGLSVRAFGWTVCILSFLLLGGAVFLLVFGFNQRLSAYVQTMKWKKLLSEGRPAGSLRTAQAEYIYGSYRGQWVAIREGSVCETLPQKATAGRIAAVSLCQNPRAESVLIVGSGLGLCSQFLQLPQIRSVGWASTDPEYARKINTHIPAEMRISDGRFQRLGEDLRQELAKSQRRYDIVIVNLPDATSSVLNRYYTIEFYDQVKRSLKAGGVVAVRVTAGENIMGTELINMGASIKLTLGRVFARFVLTPGEESWFIASDSEELTMDPATLRDRFRSIEGAEAVFPAEGLLSVYLPERAGAALERYSRADLPEHLLINRDSRPLTHLYSLLLTAKRSGTPVIRLAKLLSLAGPSVFLVPILVLVVLRVVYVLSGEAGRGRGGFDSSLLVFSAGAVGIGTVIVLMYLYQTYFGSLYLHIGIISSLFMVGLTGTGVATGTFLSRAAAKGKVQARIQEALLICVVAVHVLLLTGISSVPDELWAGAKGGAMWESGHLLFAGAFLLSGLCAGCYFPIAAGKLRACGFEVGGIAGKLEACDHLGAAVGAVATGLILVPVLGPRAVLLVFASVMLANTPVALVALLKPRRLRFAEAGGSAFRRIGYVLFGVAAVLVVCSNVLVSASGRLMPSVPRQTAQSLVGELRLQQVSIVPETTGRESSYFKVHRTEPNTTGLAGYVFSSQDFAPGVRGFGGKINLAVYVDAAFNLIDFELVRSNETPSYLRLLDKWLGKLKGRRLLDSAAFSGIESVSGATVSSQAIMLALERSAQTFARDVVGLWAGEASKKGLATGGYVPDARAGYILGAAVLGLIVICAGGFRMRLAVLAGSCIVGGFILNAQYCAEQAATILSLHTPAVGLSGAFMLAVGVPLLVLLFGNIYCGYICPFGAAQELLSYVVPRRFKGPLDVETMKKARFLKYVILFVLITAFFLSRERTTLSADPLISIFGSRLSLSGIAWPGLNWGSARVLVLAGVLVGSAIYTRFWCRYLCPGGAFLSLFNRAGLLRRLLPARKWGRCEFGLSAKDQLDCIYCDRCRNEALRPIQPVRLKQGDDVKRAGLSRALLVGVTVLAILICAVSIERLATVLPAYEGYAPSSVASGGQPRDVDIQRIEELIRQRRLSDREAEFYKKLDQ